MHSPIRAAHAPAFTSFARATKKTALLLFSIAMLLVAGAVPVRGQSALDGFDPDANGTIRAVVVQPDGKILIGGDFTTLAPNGGPTVTRNHIARLNPDGTLDTAFDPNANNSVLAISVQADGKILAGGSFTSIGGQTRNHIARLDATTGSADSFDPNANDCVFSIAVQPDGKILVGGCFYIHVPGTLNSIGGQPRNHIARLDPTTGLADSFDPDPGTASNVDALLVQADGKIVVSGAFTHLGGQTRNNLARLDPTTGLADPFDPNANDEVHAIAIQADGKILAGGFFTTIGGQSRSSIARIDPTTGAADSFNPNSDNGVFAFAVQADGKILVGGEFRSIGGQQRHQIARLDPITGSADSFDPSANAQIYSIAVQADGKILVGGASTHLGGQTRNHIARLETDGRLDQTLNLNLAGPLTSFVNAIAVQPDGKVLIGGTFTNVLGVARSNIARLNTDGTLDMAFNPNANGEVDAIAVQPDGRILVGGFFNGTNSIGGQPRNFIARLDAATGSADSFAPNANNVVRSIALQADGKILAGGLFTSIGGQMRNRIARLDGTTGLADAFDPNANGNVFSIVVQADGKILAAGTFSGTNSIGGATRNRIARLDATAGLADSFDPNANGSVFCIAVQPDGKIVAGGAFSGTNSIGGATRNRIARLDAITALADSFDPNANNLVESICVQADGKILAGGYFNGANSIGGQPRNYVARLDAITGLADSFDPSANNLVFSVAVQADGKILGGGIFNGANSIGGQARDFFARLSNDTAALQNLAVTQTTVTWNRGGSSPQFTRVTFEYSTDNLIYTPVGNGAAAGSNWTLTGLNFGTGQNFYIRARGFYRSGCQNGSESIMESVRSVFLGEVPLVSVVSRKVHGVTAFDINLPVTGNPGVECRSGGVNGNYELIFSFANTLTSVGNASVTSGTGSVSSHMIDADDAHNYIVDLTKVSNAQMVTVSLTNVNDSTGNSSSSVPISMGVLLGDTTANDTVNASDVGQTKSNSGQAVNASNFRTDVNVSGLINASDVGLVKSKVGTGF